MTIAADFRHEEERTSRFVHLRSARNEIPGRREILPAARLVEGGVDGQAIEIDARAMRQLGRDDRAEALLAPNDEPTAVGRPRRRAVVVAVVGETSHLTVEIDDEQVAPLIDVFVALMQIRDEGERARVGTPGWILHVDAEVREGAWHTAGAWHDVQLRGRRCDRIARISEIAALIESRVHPIVDLPLESFGELSLRRVGVRWRPHARPAHERDPAVVGTEDRRRRDAIDLKGLPGGSVHAQEPYCALLAGVRRRRGERTTARGECEERSVRAPAWIGRAERGIADANRRRRTIRRRQPYFALTRSEEHTSELQSRFDL